jgi:probable phosphoglycerate mutase
MVPETSPLKVRFSIQPCPEGEDAVGRGELEGEFWAVGAVGVPQAATARASAIAARRPADPGMCRRMLPVTRASDLAEAMRSIERAYLIGVDGATEVLLIRHGDVYDDAEDEVDPPLSATGRQQAKRLAERLRKLKVDALYSSPLKRALETARALGLEPRIDPRLVEVATTLDGSSHIEVTEPPDKVVERMRAAVADAVAAHPGGRVVMIGHGVAILHYLCDVMRLEFGQLRIYPRFTGINVVRVLGERRMVGSLGDVAHLESG